MLLSGLRDDVRAGCTIAATLPSRATAGVECQPTGGAAEQVGAYLFKTDEAMLSAYFARMAAEGVKPQRGSCPTSAGDGIYVPTPGDDAAGPARIGCFVNEFGISNYRITYPDAHVYVGVLGRDRDMDVLGDWIWRGNQDQPGSPTIWRDPSTP